MAKAKKFAIVDPSKYAKEIRLKAPQGGEPVAFEAAAEGESKLKKFTMTAYTGAAVKVGFGWPVVVDLSGMTVAAQAIPILKDHEAALIVGHSTAIDISAQRIKVAGLISGIGEASQEVTALSGNGFPWQSSIGASIDRMEFVDRGQRVNVNGKSFEGPIYVARKTQLNEVSFVAMGADSKTSATVAASKNGVLEMTFDQWLEAKNFNAAEMGDDQKATLKLAYDAEQAAKKPAGKDDGITDITEQMKARREIEATEDERVAAIRKSCKDHPELSAQAIREGWTVERAADKAEVATIRASRPTGPAIHSTGRSLFNPGVIEAAACQALGLQHDTLEARFKPEVLEAAHGTYKGRITLQEMLINAAWSNGYSGHSFKADPEGALRAAFSSAAISGILSNIANKFLLQSYSAVESSWRMISAIRPVSDFKEVTSYRLTGDMEFEEVAPDGNVKHGTLAEQNYGNAAKTYGKMLTLGRTKIIDDDMGALAGVPKILGRGAALKLNKVFWTSFMDNAAFFAATHNTAGDTGNANYQEGADTALSIASLTAAELLFLNQVDPQGNPLGVVPKFLLVPNALKVPAKQFCHDTEIRDPAATKAYTTKNPHAGNWEPVVSSYLSNATISGYSTKAHYLLADPADVPVIETVFLNGQETPMFRTAELEIGKLGIAMESVFDFGVRKQDFRGGVKSKGEA